MKIPRSIEWRAGAVLVAVSGLCLSLMLVLALSRMDIGIEVAGQIEQDAQGRVLSATLPVQSLTRLQRSTHLSFRQGGETTYHRISSYDGRVSNARDSVDVRIAFEGYDPTPILEPGRVKAMLLEQRRASVLGVLLNTVLSPQTERAG